MKIRHEVVGRRLVLHLEAASGEGPAGAAHLDADQVFFGLPQLWSLDETHPDLLGLTALLVVQPFARGVLELDHPVSSGFAEAVAVSFGLEVSPVDPALEPRQVVDGVPGLAFSGGVDSVAALAVLPEETVSVFLDRHTVPERSRRSLYRPAAAHHACAELARRRRRVVRVATDLEHARSPVGFPVDLSTAAPAVLLADLLRLDALSWGTIAESSYRVGHQAFVDYHRRGMFRSWARVLDAVGLPVLNPVAGVSEVGSSSIVLSEGYAGLAQSCIRGAVGEPCRNCWKCFRKSLLDAALTGSWPSVEVIEQMFHVPEARLQLSKVPIKHENVVAFACGRYEGSHPLLLALGRRVRSAELDLDHLTRWYTPSSQPWPERYRARVADRLDRVLGAMDAADEDRFRGWSMDAVTAAPAALAAAASFGPLLQAMTDRKAPSARDYYPAPAPAVSSAGGGAA